MHGQLGYAAQDLGLNGIIIDDKAEENLSVWPSGDVGKMQIAALGHGQMLSKILFFFRCDVRVLLFVMMMML